jgi:hypothetical protein
MNPYQDPINPITHGEWDAITQHLANAIRNIGWATINPKSSVRALEKEIRTLEEIKKRLQFIVDRNKN